MNCPHCTATSTRERAKKTKLGYATFFCPTCQHIFNERTGTPFNSLEFPTDVVLLAVLWRLRYKLSLRDVAEMFLARGFTFTYFYAHVLWQRQDIPNSLQKQGAHVPGYRPGETTRRHLTTILNRITLAGALFLGLTAVLPFVATIGGSQLLSSSALLIAVGVVLDTVRQVEAQMIMRNYAGILT